MIYYHIICLKVEDGEVVFEALYVWVGVGDVSEGHFRNKHGDGKSDSREKGTGKMER